MKKLLLFPLILLCVTAFGQYQPTVVKGRQWSQYYPGMMGGGHMLYLQVGDDTTFNNKTYHRINQVDSSGNFLKEAYYVLEDINTPSFQLFYINNGSFADSMFLDFSLPIGDSTQFTCMQNNTLYYVLDSIGSYQDLNNTTRKQYFYHVNIMGGNTFHFNWIEGLGCIADYFGGIDNYFSPGLCITDVPLPNLLCISDTSLGQLYRQTPTTDCTPDRIGIHENPLSKLNLFPNPASDFIELGNLPVGQNISLKIINMNGQNILCSTSENEMSIDISHLPEGLYLLKLEYEGYIHSERFLIKR